MRTVDVTCEKCGSVVRVTVGQTVHCSCGQPLAAPDRKDTPAPAQLAPKKSGCPLSADKQAQPDAAQAKSKAKAKPKREPRLLGEFGFHIRRPDAPVLEIVPAEHEGAVAIHAHAPDQPCKQTRRA